MHPNMLYLLCLLKCVTLHTSQYGISYTLLNVVCLKLRYTLYVSKYRIPHTWSSLDKGESLACQIPSPFNNKLGCFYKNNQYFCLIGKLSGKPVTLLCLKSSMHYRYVSRYSLPSMLLDIVTTL